MLAKVNGAKLLQGATAYIITGGYMRKLEFAIQVSLATAIIFGLLGLGGIIASTSAQAAPNLGNLDGTIINPPTRDDAQDPKPGKTDPIIENHGTSLPKQATHATLNKDGSIDLN